jgi:glycosyltransferase involved in cell wall biosynthesis
VATPAGSDHHTTRRALELLSVVAPVYQEEALIARFYERVCATLVGVPFELVLVDDGSSDGSAQELERLAERDSRVKVVTLSRNFGHQHALTAGLDHAAGDAVVMLDSDLQDPPELIPELLDHWRAGVDVVSAVRESRAGETRFKLTTAHLFYRLFGRVANIDLAPQAGDFRLLDRRALDSLRSLRERDRFLRGMSSWIGFSHLAVSYARGPRVAGETKYTLRRMLRFSLDALFSFSSAPLQLATLLGFLCSAAAFLGLPLVIVARIAGIYVPGVSTILFVVLLLGGIQLITVGIIGEYVGRIYDEVKRRPLYIVKSRRNLASRESVDEGETAEPEHAGIS